jgi:hypothetical protein
MTCRPRFPLQKIAFDWLYIYLLSLLRVSGWTAEGLEFESRYRQEFSPLHVVHTGSGAHPASCPMGPGGGLSPGVKRPLLEADHSPPSAEVKNTWIYTSTPPYGLMA